MARLKCGECGMAIQTAQDDVTTAEKILARHMEKEHTTLAAKHAAVLTDMQTLLSDVMAQIPVTYKRANALQERVSQLLGVSYTPEKSNDENVDTSQPVTGAETGDGEIVPDVPATPTD